MEWDLKFCISNKLANDTKAFVHEEYFDNKVDIFVHKDPSKFIGDI